MSQPLNPLFTVYKSILFEINWRLSGSQLCRTKQVKHINLLAVLGIAMVMLMLLHVPAGHVDNLADVSRWIITINSSQVWCMSQDFRDVYFKGIRLPRRLQISCVDVWDSGVLVLASWRRIGTSVTYFLSFSTSLVFKVHVSLLVNNWWWAGACWESKMAADNHDERWPGTHICARTHTKVWLILSQEIDSKNKNEGWALEASRWALNHFRKQQAHKGDQRANAQELIWGLWERNLCVFLKS